MCAPMRDIRVGPLSREYVPVYPGSNGDVRLPEDEIGVAALVERDGVLVVVRLVLAQRGDSPVLCHRTVQFADLPRAREILLRKTL